MAFPWFINGGDPNHLLTGMILQVVAPFASNLMIFEKKTIQKIIIHWLTKIPCIQGVCMGDGYSKKIATHPDIAHPRQSPWPTMKGIPSKSLLVKVARGVFQFGVLKQQRWDR